MTDPTTIHEIVENAERMAIVERSRLLRLDPLTRRRLLARAALAELRRAEPR